MELRKLLHESLYSLQGIPKLHDKAQQISVLYKARGLTTSTLAHSRYTPQAQLAATRAWVLLVADYLLLVTGMATLDILTVPAPWFAGAPGTTRAAAVAGVVCHGTP